MRHGETLPRAARRCTVLAASLVGALCAIGCFGLGDAVDLVSTTYVCGNGKTEPYESCDDGNERRGDGCSANCRLESGWVCSDGQRCKRQSLRPRPRAVVDAGVDAAARDAGERDAAALDSE